jgi:hypothetical protein
MGRPPSPRNYDPIKFKKLFKQANKPLTGMVLTITTSMNYGTLKIITISYVLYVEQTSIKNLLCPCAQEAAKTNQ